MNKLKKFGDFSKYSKLNESINYAGFKILPEGSSIPDGGVVKFGVDPTSDKLHLGHLIPMLMVKKLKDNGHPIHIILGTFTAQMGDPSGKNEMRPILSLSSTKSNADSIISQLHRILGKDITVHYNNEWFDKMSLPEMMSILSKYTVDFLMSRDSFQKRKESGNGVGMHELIVPILQGLDSVQLEAAIEVGGTDQLFNFLMSRDIQSKMGQKAEICLMSPIINGTDGRKMSKSYGNCIYINDAPKDVFGKVMSISDTLMHEWYPLFVDSYNKEDHPMNLKKNLAVIITDIIWGEGSGEKERTAFESISSGSLPEDIPSLPNKNIIDFVKDVKKSSRNEARRLIIQNGVSVTSDDGETWNKATIDTVLNIGDIVKVGKRGYGKVI